MRRLAAPLAVLLVLLLAGCGAQGGSGPEFEGAEAGVAAAVEALQEAGQQRDTRKICTQLLAPQLASRLGRGCEARLGSALRSADSFELEVEDVRIAGDTAFARVQSGPREDDVRRLELARAGTGWRISSLG